jgi:hypothetical protein
MMKEKVSWWKKALALLFIVGGLAIIPFLKWPKEEGNKEEDKEANKEMTQKAGKEMSIGYVQVEDLPDSLQQAAKAMLADFKPSHPDMKQELCVRLTDEATREWCLEVVESFDGTYECLIHHCYEWKDGKFSFTERNIDGLLDIMEKSGWELERLKSEYAPQFTHYAIVPVASTLALWLKDEARDKQVLYNLAPVESEDKMLLCSEYSGTSKVKFYEHGAILMVDGEEDSYDEVGVILDGVRVLHRSEQGTVGSGPNTMGFCHLDGKADYDMLDKMEQWLGQEVKVTPNWRTFNGDTSRFVK